VVSYWQNSEFLSCELSSEGDCMCDRKWYVIPDFSIEELIFTTHSFHFLNRARWTE